MDYDLKITGGTIIDGTGSPARDGDVAIRDGKIAAVGDAPGKAAATIDARGRVVAPGFVDIHTHYDAQVLWDRMLTVSPWHGVTTVVMGNCGFGVAPTRPEHRDLIMRTLEKVEGMSADALRAGLGDDWPFETFPQYLDAVETRGPAINVGAMIGHTPVRLYVMGEESTERPATDDEIAAMRAIVRRGHRRRRGGLRHLEVAHPRRLRAASPVPSRAAELPRSWRSPARWATPGSGVIQATIGRRAGLRASSPRSPAPPAGPSRGRRCWPAMGGPACIACCWTQSVRAARPRAARSYPQVSCRPLNFEFTMAEPFPFESMRGVQPDLGRRTVDARRRSTPTRRSAPTFGTRLARPGRAAAAAAGSAPWCRGSRPTRRSRSATWPSWRASAASTRPTWCSTWRSSRTSRPASAWPCSTSTRTRSRSCSPIPHTMLGLSDAGAHASQLCDSCFSTHLLRHWVRERRRIPLERGGAQADLASRPRSSASPTGAGWRRAGRPTWWCSIPTRSAVRGCAG